MADSTSRTDTHTIDTLVEQHLAGCDDAARMIVESTLPSVQAYVYSRSLPGIDVEDVVQRAFVEAFQSIAGYEIGTNFRGWLLTIAKYQLLMETTRLRRLASYQARFVPVALAREVERRLAEAPIVDDRLEHLRSCLVDVPANGRDVLHLRYEQGLQVSEIAERLKRSAGAVRKQLCMLRQRLHDCVSRKMASELGHG